MTNLLTVDEFRSSAKDGAAPAGTVFRFAVTDPEAIADSRKVRFVFSDGTVDRSGDSIDPAGWQIDTFNQESGCTLVLTIHPRRPLARVKRGAERQQAHR
jgi:hypothetical protein